MLHRSAALGLLLLCVASCDNVTSEGGPPDRRVATVAIPVSADAVVAANKPHTNQGQLPFVQVKKQNQYRTLVAFDAAAIAAAIGDGTLEGAVLELDIKHAKDDISTGGKVLSVHAMNEAWTESGVAWGCASMSGSGNSASCPAESAWDLENPGPWQSDPVALATVLPGQEGSLQFDVTASLQSMLAGAPNHGWLVKALDESTQGSVMFFSREADQPARLVLTIGDPPPPPDTTAGSSDTAESMGGTGGTTGGDATAGDSAGGTSGTGDPPTGPTGSVRGRFVMAPDDPEGEPIPLVGAMVDAGGIQVSTDNHGTFVAEGVPVGAEINVVANLTGYSTSQKRVAVEEGVATVVELTARPTASEEVIDIEVGAVVESMDPESGEVVGLEIPPDAFVDVEGNPVVGNVMVDIALLNDPDELIAAPGGMMADVGGGTEGALESFGMAEFKLTDDAGNPIEARDDLAEPFTVRIPLSNLAPDGQSYYEGQQLGLWNFDEDQGIWVQEGSGTVVAGQAGGYIFVAQVMHFSWWNADQPLEQTGCVQGSLEDEMGLPIEGAQVTLVGLSYNGQDETTSGADGTFCIAGKNNGIAEVKAYFFDPDTGEEIQWTSDPVALPDGAQCGGTDCAVIPTFTIDTTAYTCQQGYVPDKVDLNPTPGVLDRIVDWELLVGGLPVESGYYNGEEILAERTFCVGAAQGSAEEIRLSTPLCPGTVVFALDDLVGACGGDSCQSLDLTPLFDCIPDPGGTTGDPTGGTGGMVYDLGGPDPTGGDPTGGDPTMGGELCPTPDADGDGITECAGDCNDMNPDVYPGAVELCTDPSTDRDCDGLFGAEEAMTCAPEITGESCADYIDLRLGSVYSGDLNDNVEDTPICAFGPDEVLRFAVPEGGSGEVRLFNALDDGVTFTLQRGDQCDPGILEYIDCVDGDQTLYLAPGQYFLTAHFDAMQGQGDGTYSLSIGQSDPSAPGGCTIPDEDGDGSTICDADCDDSDPARYPGATEVCGDGIDSNCDGLEGPTGPCSTGLTGACDAGTLVCEGGDEFCLQTTPATAEICFDGIDNDCDPATPIDGAGCVDLGPGSSCSRPIDLDAQDLFATYDFVGAVDTVAADGACGMQGELDVDRVLKFTVPDFGMPADVTFFGSRGVDDPAMGETQYTLYRDNCGDPGSEVLCGFGTVDQFNAQLDAGTYYVVATRFSWGGEAELQAPGTTSLQVGIRDPNTGTCTPGDIDADGFTPCDGDCVGNDAASFPGNAETCGDGIDNNCDGGVDNVWGPCTGTGLPGKCDEGYRSCDGATEVCNPVYSPGQLVEICDDGVDSNCDGVSTETEPNCVVAQPGASCDLPIEIGEIGVASGDFSDAIQRINEQAPCGMGEEFNDLAMAFDVTGMGGEVRVDFSGTTNGVSAAVYRDSCDGTGLFFDCLTVWDGDMPFSYPREPGRYYIVVNPAEAVYQFGLDPADVTWSVAVTQTDDMGQCLQGDTDMDGFSPCDGDCDESDPGVGPGNAESCDGIDNDCNGAVDDVPPTSCSTGLLGVCGDGLQTCGACETVNSPTPEVCDGLDNDCNGTVDDGGVCTGGGAGDTCMDPLDVGTGGTVSGSLAGFVDDPESPCNMGGQGVDAFVKFTVPPGGPWYTDIFVQSDPWVEWGVFSGSCGMLGPIPGGDCGYMSGQPLDPGDYYVVLEGDPTATFSVSVSSRDDMGQCSIPDGDGDMRTICDGDCNDADGSVFPGATEDCANGVDDNCDGVVDGFPPGYGCSVSGQMPGTPCEQGVLECQGGVETCVQQVFAEPEVCGDLKDQDCDGEVDEVDCTLPPLGEACANPTPLSTQYGDVGAETDGVIVGTLAGASDDVCGDGADLVYSFTTGSAPTGYQAWVQFEGAAAEMGCVYPSIASSVEECVGDPMMCYGGMSSAFVPADSTGYVRVERDPNCMDPGGDDFSLRLFVAEADTGACAIPSDASLVDVDGDGVDVCQGDCNDADPSVPMAETCNGVDDDCNGFVDDISGSCSTALLGACASGHFECIGSGDASCVQDVLAGIEYCDDGIDSDCDGVDDAQETVDMTCLPGGGGGGGGTPTAIGDACMMAPMIDVGMPWMGDLGTAPLIDGCLCDGMACSGPTDVLMFDLPPDFGSWDVSFDVMSDAADLSVTLGSSLCEDLQQNACFNEPVMAQTVPLMPGQYYVYVRSQGTMPGPYQLTLNATGV